MIFTVDIFFRAEMWWSTIDDVVTEKKLYSPSEKQQTKMKWGRERKEEIFFGGMKKNLFFFSNSISLLRRALPSPAQAV